MMKFKKFILSIGVIAALIIFVSCAESDASSSAKPGNGKELNDGGGETPNGEGGETPNEEGGETPNEEEGETPSSDGDIENIETKKLPSKFTMKTPSSMNNTATRGYITDNVKQDFNILLNRLLITEQVKQEVAVRYMVIDTVIANLEPTTDATEHSETTIPVSDMLKAFMTALYGFEPEIDEYWVGTHIYQKITEENYDYRFYENSSQGDEILITEIKWSEDKTKVYLRNETKVPGEGIDQLNIFAYDDATKTADITLWDHSTPVSNAKRGGKRVGEGEEEGGIEGGGEEEGGEEGGALEGEPIEMPPSAFYLSMSLKADENSANDGVYFGFSEFNAPDEGADFYKLETTGYADNKGGYFEMDYTGNQMLGTTPFIPSRFIENGEFNASGDITYASKYNIYSTEGDGWDFEGELSGVYADTYNNSFDTLKSGLFNSELLTTNFQSGEKVNFYDISGAVAYDLYYITNTDLGAEFEIGPLPTNFENNLIGLGIGIGEGKVWLCITNKTLYSSSSDLFVYKFNQVSPKKYERATPASITK